MTSEHLDAYLSRLVLELENRGLGTTRIVAEARDHLVDAIEEGLRLGLSQDAAEQKAFLRFGAPENIAAHCRTSQAGGVGSASRIATIEYEVLLQTYRSLLTRSQESKIAAALERSQSGQQWRILDPARLPEAPVGPSRLRVGAIGGFVGLGLGLLFVAVFVRRRTQDRLPPQQTA